MFKQLKRIRLLQDRGFPILALILLEFCAIVLAILLGFMANDWREGRQKAAVADLALKSLAREMSYNHRQMVTQYAYYRNYVEEFRQIAESGKVEDMSSLLAYELDTWNGAMPPMLRSSSYQMMLNTGIMSHLPFEVADSLSVIYNIQSGIDRIEDAYITTATAMPQSFNADYAAHVFALFYEIMPSVIGSYQLVGRPILAEHGYDMDIEEEQLAAQIARQKSWISQHIP
jgi:hypothetical protein